MKTHQMRHVCWKAFGSVVWAATGVSVGPAGRGLPSVGPRMAMVVMAQRRANA